MLDFLQKLRDDPEGPYDAIFFLPGDKEGETHIEANQFKEPGEKLGGSSMGDSYEVILFKDDTKNDKLYDVDRFEAIFSDPYEYISNLIPQNWFGMIVKKTTTSGAFIQRIFDKMIEV
jgi:hypothetical protein